MGTPNSKGLSLNLTRLWPESKIMINLNHLCSFPAATTTTTSKEWREFLLNHDRNAFVNGEFRELKDRNIGSGVVEVYSKKIKIPK